jgi:hypothetical protein
MTAECRRVSFRMGDDLPRAESYFCYFHLTASSGLQASKATV